MFGTTTLGAIGAPTTIVGGYGASYGATYASPTYATTAAPVSYTAPTYAAPATYAAPTYTAPAYTAPVVTAAAAPVTYSTPAYTTPAYTAPVTEVVSAPPAQYPMVSAYPGSPFAFDPNLQVAAPVVVAPQPVVVKRAGCC